MQKVPDTTENMSRCLCSGCPSYPGAGGFFCAKGKSDRPVQRRGCMCTGCVNFKEYGLQDGYYCASGIAGVDAQ